MEAIIGLGLASVVGFTMAGVEIRLLRLRVAQLETNQLEMVKVLRGQVTNMNSIHGSIQQINAMRRHWLGLVKS